MFRNPARLVCLAVVLVSSIGAAWSTDAQLKATLELRYADMKKAMAAHDGKAIAALLAPDFVSVEASAQTQTAEQMIAGVNALQPDPNKTSETTLTAVTRSGDTAMVEQRYEMKTLRTGADGVQHHIELVALSTDTWIKSGTTWLMRRTVTNELSLFRDGQLVSHQQKPSAG